MIFNVEVLIFKTNVLEGNQRKLVERFLVLFLRACSWCFSPCVLVKVMRHIRLQRLCDGICHSDTAVRRPYFKITSGTAATCSGDGGAVAGTAPICVLHGFWWKQILGYLRHVLYQVLAFYAIP